jgi:hypothetical protein
LWPELTIPPIAPLPSDDHGLRRAPVPETQNQRRDRVRQGEADRIHVVGDLKKDVAGFESAGLQLGGEQRQVAGLYPGQEMILLGHLDCLHGSLEIHPGVKATTAIYWGSSLG